MVSHVWGSDNIITPQRTSRQPSYCGRCDLAFAPVGSKNFVGLAVLARPGKPGRSCAGATPGVSAGRTGGQRRMGRSLGCLVRAAAGRLPGALAYCWLSPGVRHPHLQCCCRWFWPGVWVARRMYLWWQAQPLPAESYRPLRRRADAPCDPCRRFRPALKRARSSNTSICGCSICKTSRAGSAVRGLIRLNVHTTSLTFLPGDVLRVTRVRLHRVHSLANPGGFDFARFMQRRGIYVIGGVSNPTRVQMQEQPQGCVSPTPAGTVAATPACQRAGASASPLRRGLSGHDCGPAWRSPDDDPASLS